MTKFYELMDKKKDYSRYLHVWEGELESASSAMIFKDAFTVEEFEEDTQAFKYFGVDFGYAVDPTAAVRCWVKDNKLFISHEAYGNQIEIDEVAPFVEERLPEFKRYTSYADSSRPESISFMNRQGYMVEKAIKFPDSVMAGIKYLRGFDKIFIHKRCEKTIEEFCNYSYKVDPKTENIKLEPVDAYNHCIDALRYALCKQIYSQNSNYDAWAKW